MIESKVIEKFMEDNGLEPYDVFMAEGKLENYSPLYFNEDLELRSMFLDGQNYEGPICIVLLYGLLTGLYPVRNKINKKRTESKSETVVKENRNLVCKVSVKGYVMSDEELDYLRKACHLASNVAFENDEKNIYRKLNEYLMTGERSYDRK
jgi:hypothetical protein